MAYSDFTLRSAVAAFGLTEVLNRDLFPDVPPAPAGPYLRELLAANFTAALMVNSEYARGHLFSTPVLLEAKRLAGGRLAVLPGVTFDVDRAAGLVGFCDYLLTADPDALYLRGPILAAVEAKREDVIAGLGQCAATMVAVQRFNAADGTPRPVVYGCVTSGTNWRFLTLTGTELAIDRRDYSLREVDHILGILVHIAAA
jgi:hypothetical protein